jgi:hypothetical protein
LAGGERALSERKASRQPGRLQGQRIAAGNGVWDGILDSRANTLRPKKQGSLGALFRVFSRSCEAC